LTPSLKIVKHVLHKRPVLRVLLKLELILPFYSLPQWYSGLITCQWCKSV